MYQVFVCHNPKQLFTPLIYNSPHSGRIYQKSFLNQTSLSLKEIRVSEDFFVDQLLTSVTDNGSFFLEACFPRSFVDVNRSHNDLDSRLINKLVFNRMNSRTAAGLGVIPRVVGDGIEIYSKKLSLDEVNSRLETFYFPYHSQLEKLINLVIKNFGFAILIDIHSMPHNCLDYLANQKHGAPQIVLGDCLGSSCCPMFSQKVFDIFVSQGFRVERNSPFSGGFITKHYGEPNKNIQAIQIEIDRSLYMNEKNFNLHAGFFKLKEKFQNVVRLLSKIKHQKSHSMRAAE